MEENSSYSLSLSVLRVRSWLSFFEIWRGRVTDFNRQQIFNGCTHAWPVTVLNISCEFSYDYYDQHLISTICYILYVLLKDALKDGHAIVAGLGNIFKTELGHCVMIYAVDDQKTRFKIKDSHGVKYEIPIDRPDFFQVTSFVRIFTFINILFRLWRWKLSIIRDQLDPIRFWFRDFLIEITRHFSIHNFRPWSVNLHQLQTLDSRFRGVFSQDF